MILPLYRNQCEPFKSSRFALEPVTWSVNQALALFQELVVHEGLVLEVLEIDEGEEALELLQEEVQLEEPSLSEP